MTDFFKNKFFLIFILILSIGLFLFLNNNKNFKTETVTEESEENINSSSTILFEEDNLPLSNQEEIEDYSTSFFGLEKEIKENIEEEKIKAVYLTSWSASSNSRIDYIIDLAKDTEINAVVIDLKDWQGYVSYDSNIEEVKKYQTRSIKIKDLKSLIDIFHKEEIYVIVRISVFQDLALAKALPEVAVKSYQKIASSTPTSTEFFWEDNIGSFWVDPASKDVWDYNIKIAKEALSYGADEINFDYVRFPSDGNLKDMNFPVWDKKTPRNIVLRNFFKYLREKMPSEILSIDLFGLTTVNRDDLGIGQIIEDSFEYFDYVCPMVYPSHYAEGFQGFENPAEHPYFVVYYSLKSALVRWEIFKEVKSYFKEDVDSKIRPWIQDFSLKDEYDTRIVKLEIEAAEDSLNSHFNGFMLWNASNIYTREALRDVSN